MRALAPECATQRFCVARLIGQEEGGYSLESKFAALRESMLAATRPSKQEEEEEAPKTYSENSEQRSFASILQANERDLHLHCPISLSRQHYPRRRRATDVIASRG